MKYIENIGAKMRYESEFRIKEKEFRPREKYKHQQVVDELANIVKRADLDIEELIEAVDNECIQNEKLYDLAKKYEKRAILYALLFLASIGFNVVMLW